MDGINIFIKNEKDIDTNYTNIESGYRDGIWNWKMCHANKEK